MIFDAMNPTIKKKIDSEAATRAADDEVLDGKINTLRTDLEKADGDIRIEMGQMKSELDVKDTELQNQITDNAMAISENYTELDGKINDLGTELRKKDTEISNTVSKMDERLTANDKAHDEAISKEADDRSKEDAAIRGTIETLSSENDAAHTNLNKAIQDEATERSGQDEILDGKILSEAQTRASEDARLEELINGRPTPSDVDAKIEAHNKNKTAHSDIRTKIGDDIEAHNKSTNAHDDIRRKIGEDIEAHNTSSSAHTNLRNLISGLESSKATFEDVDGKIAAHNDNSDAHPALGGRLTEAEGSIKTLTEDVSGLKTSKQTAEQVNAIVASHNSRGDVDDTGGNHANDVHPAILQRMDRLDSAMNTRVTLLENIVTGGEAGDAGNILQEISSIKDSITWGDNTVRGEFAAADAQLKKDIEDSLAAVATSGKYSDLSGTPTIPTELPNKYALKIKGTDVDISYDGSSEETLTLDKKVVGLDQVDNISKKDLLNNTELKGNSKAETPGSTDNSKRIATTEFVQSLINSKIESSKAMRFKGTIGINGNITSLPATHTVGDTYRVITAGEYAGQNCEIGDMITCIAGGTTAADSHWTVIQSNIDGAVIGPASSVDGCVVVFNGGSGKSIKDSEVPLKNLVTQDSLSSSLGAYLPLTGGTMTGPIVLTGSNPHLGLTDATGTAYFQTYDDGTGSFRAGFGYGWTSSFKIDPSGNMAVPGSVTASSFNGTASKAISDKLGNQIDTFYESATHASSTYATQSEVSNKYDRTGGEISGNVSITGTTSFGGNVTMDGSGTPLIIGSNGKIGLRAKGAGLANAGQINISDSWYGAGNNRWGAQISAYDSVSNKYNQFRVSHDGLQYLVYDNATGQETAQQIALIDDIPDLSIYAKASDVNSALGSKANSSDVYTKTQTDSAISSAASGRLPNFVNNIGNTNAGNPRQVRFISVDYNKAATYFKMSGTSCHDNGTSYQFLEDIIIGVSTNGTIVCNVYKYCQQSCGTASYNLVDGLERQYGDVFYTHDETNKIVDFYILMGQYASAQFTPPTKIGSTTIQYVTPYTGSPVYHSSGARNWANGNSTLYATLKDIPDVSIYAKTSDVNSALGSKANSSDVYTKTQTDSAISSAIANKADASAIPDVSGFETKANAITGLSVSGTTITYTRGNGTTGSITTQDTKVTVDTALSSTSTNPVQNKVINSALAGKSDSNHTHDDRYYTESEINTKISTLNTAIGKKADASAIPDVSGFETKANAITGLSVSGTTITYTRGNGTTGSITTQDTNTTYEVATTSTNGLMSSTDKSKLDGIRAGADAVSFTRILDSGTKIGTITINDVTTELFCQTNTDTTYGNASSTSAGLMSADDKKKLDGITASADSVSITRSLTSGTKIGTITINGEDTELYCQTNTDTNTTYSAGTGLVLNGTTINHSNSVTANTSGVGSATAIPVIKYDAQGHITSTSTVTVYPPTSVGTAGQIWMSDGSGAGVWRSLVTISTSEPSGGQDGDLWFQYEE